MAYKPPKQQIDNNDVKNIPSSEAIYEALKYKIDQPTISGTAGQLLQLDGYTTDPDGILNEPITSWVNPPAVGANTTLSNLVAPTAVNQVLLGQDGTAAAPAYSFISDPDLGLYRDSTNVLGLAGSKIKSLAPAYEFGPTVAGSQVTINFRHGGDRTNFQINGGTTFVQTSYGLDLPFTDASITSGQTTGSTTYSAIGAYYHRHNQYLQSQRRFGGIFAQHKLGVGKLASTIHMQGGMINATRYDARLASETGAIVDGSDTVTIFTPNAFQRYGAQILSGPGDYLQFVKSGEPTLVAKIVDQNVTTYSGNASQYVAYTLDQNIPVAYSGATTYILPALMVLRNSDQSLALEVDHQGKTILSAPLQLNGSTSGDVQVTASATTTPYSLVLPAAQGAANAFLENDGSGNLSWSVVDLSNLANKTLSNLTAPTAVNQVLLGQDGTVSAPAYSFISSSNTGLYYANNIVGFGGLSLGLAVNGNYKVAITPSNGTFFSGPVTTSGLSGGFPYTNISLDNVSNSYFNGALLGINSAENLTRPLERTNIGYLFSSTGPSATFRRFAGIHAVGKVSVGWDGGAVNGVNPSSLYVRPRNYNQIGGGALFTTADSGTSLTVTWNSIAQNIAFGAGPGDFLQSTGSPGVTAKITGFTARNVVTVDTPLNAGTLTVIPNIAIFAKEDGSEVFSIDYDGAVNLDGALVVNESGADKDTRIEGDTDANLVFVDASADKVGIGTATPSEKLEVAGAVLATEYRVPNYRLDPHTHDEGTETTDFTINWANGAVHTVTLNAAGPLVITMSNPVDGGAYALRIIQGATPGTVTWPANVKWPGGTPPTLSTSTGDIDVVNLLYFDDGGGNTFYYATSALAFA